MPTFNHGKNSVFKITDSGTTLRDISTVLDEAGLEENIELADVTAFGATTKAYLGGLKDADVPIKGHLDQTTYGYLRGVLGTSTACQYGPMGSTTGYIKFTFNGILTSLKVTGQVGDKVSIDGSIKVDGAVTATTW